MSSRATLGGWLAISFIIFSLFALLSEQGIHAWHAILLVSVILILPSKLPKSLKWQCTIMQLIGWSGFIWVQLQSAQSEPPWYQPLITNIPLLVLFGAVSFLRVVVSPSTSNEKSPRGVSAFWQTLLGSHLLASVINMSAGFVVADRLQQGKGLDRIIGAIAVRCITIAAYWSPFFGGMASVLHYLGDVPLLEIWKIGIPLSVLALLFTGWEVRTLSSDNLSSFRGYPLTIDALLLPIGLLITVLLSRVLWPQVPTVILVASASLIVPCFLLFIKHTPSQSSQIIQQHITKGLGNLRGEFLLFVSAGVLSAGGSALFTLYPPLLPFDSFTPWIACALLLSIIFLAMLGVHMLVGISISAPLLLPLEPDLVLLALCYLSSWSIAIVLSPFSGMSLAFRGCYQLQLMELPRNNFTYGIFMLVISMLSFFLV